MIAGTISGYWPGARIVPAHPGRVGPTIKPTGGIIHTTDTLVGSMGAIVNSWAHNGPQIINGVWHNTDCANMIIPARASDGPPVQMVPWDRNANHAGGLDHGMYTAPNGSAVHPNTCCFGIELEAPGRLRWIPDTVGGHWMHPDTGHVIDPSQVFVDSSGHGWGLITPYQLDTLAGVLGDLVPQLYIPGPGRITTTGTYAANQVPWAACPDSAIITGHASSNPVQKTDPGPQIMAWIAARGYK